MYCNVLLNRLFPLSRLNLRIRGKVVETERLNILEGDAFTQLYVAIKKNGTTTKNYLFDTASFLLFIIVTENARGLPGTS